MEAADWDLLAVVRGCTAAAITAPSPASTPAPSSSPAPPPADGRPISPSGFHHLQDSFRPLSPCHNLITCPLDESFNFDPPLQRNQLQVIFERSTASTTTTNTTTTTTSVGCSSSITLHTHQRSKKRKNLQKRVCHLEGEGIASDMWAWRKYGQKPIKGSPYPRSYYKCSSSKGCPARKQVERNRLEPKMFIVTYTSEHSHPIPTHRNSLAGSTRQKAAEAPDVEEKGEIKEGDYGEEIMELKDMVMNDDFFVGFEELDDSDGGGFFPDQIQGGLEVVCPLVGQHE